MKKFIEITVQAKFIWGLFFSSALLIYAVIAMILGKSYIDIITIWQLVVITLVLTGLHYVIFGELILKSVSTWYKVLIHSILCYITLIISAFLIGWVSVSDFNTVVIFTVSYILLYLACILSFYVYYKATGEELNDRLTAYKQKKNLN